jgi:hypothetical protein
MSWHPPPTVSQAKQDSGRDRRPAMKQPDDEEAIVAGPLGRTKANSERYGTDDPI